MSKEVHLLSLHLLSSICTHLLLEPYSVAKNSAMHTVQTIPKQAACCKVARQMKTADPQAKAVVSYTDVLCLH